MFTQSFLEQVAERVEKLEAQSSVELVVVLSDESGGYSDLDGHCGFACVMMLLLFALYSPWEYPVQLLLAGVVLSYLVGGIISKKLWSLRRLFLPRERCRRQVESLARDAFVQRKVSHTRERTGLLLYLSAFERLGRFVPDLGIEAKVPAAVFHTQHAVWDQASESLKSLEEAVLQSLDDLTLALGEQLPRAQDDENELPNEIWLMKAGG